MRRSPLKFAAQRATPVGLALVYGLLFSLPAPAQSVSYFVTSDADLRLNDADCADNARDVEVEYTASGSETGSVLSIIVHEENVQSGENPPCPGYIQPGVQLGDFIALPAAGLFQTEDLSFSPRDLMGDERCDGAPARNSAAMLCFYVLDRAQREQANAGERLEFDTLVPAAPAVTGIVAGDTSLAFDISATDQQGDLYSYYYQYRACSTVNVGDAGSADAGASSTDAGIADGTYVAAPSTCDAPDDFLEVKASSPDNIVLLGLVNNVQYEVRARVVDDYGNESQTSAAVLIEPQPELSPLGQYQGHGSPFSFTPPNCSDGFGGMMVPLFFAFAVLLALGSRRRRPTPALVGLVVLAVVGSAGESRADFGQVNLDIRLGPNKPAIDTELVDGEPIFPIYSCFFDDAVLPELGFTLDMHLFDAFGSLQIGSGLSVSQARGKTRDLSSVGELVTGECDDKAEATGDVELTLLKIRPGLTYRFDPLLDWWNIPLVPYARVGLVGTGYAWTRGGAFDYGERAQPAGFVFGYEGSAGLMLALDFWDWIDPFAKNTSQRARALGVFNHAFLFGEAQWQEINNFGQPGYIFSPVDPTGATALPWTFHVGLAVEFL